jgi:hypothetical protein
MALLENLSFDEWVKYVFDHPVSEPHWYHTDYEKDGYWDEEAHPKTALNYLTQFLENPVEYLIPYNDDQIAQSFWFLASPTGSSYMHILFQEDIPLERRKRCAAAIYNVFEQIFAPRCTNNINFSVEYGYHTPEELRPVSTLLDAICYMWWDIAPMATASDESNPDEVTLALLEVMRKCLLLDSYTCQESALHGLGHYHYHFPEYIKAVIQEYLDNNPDLSPDLVAYAQNAMTGYVL